MTDTMKDDSNHIAGEPKLKRSLSVIHLILYGLGVTVGAGIYVLIGEAVGRAGIYTPVSFIVASIVMAFSAASFAELSSRFPVSAGEAAYVEAGFGSKELALLIGLCVITVGITSAATVSVGVSGYVQQLLDISAATIIVSLVVILGLFCIWGITESVTLAAIFAIIEAGLLVIIIVAGFWQQPQMLQQLPQLVPSTFDASIWNGIFAATLLAFFAFIGFEDMVNVAEEVKQPKRNMPIAIFVTLSLAGSIYVLLAAVAIFSGPIDELAKSPAPLSIVVDRLGLMPVAWLSIVAIIAGLNGIIVQIIMATRVLYGLSRKLSLFKIFGAVHPKTRTPHIATLAVTSMILLLALLFPIGVLAEFTSRLTIVIFICVNLALVLLKINKKPAAKNGFEVPVVIPVIGVLLSLTLLVISIA